MLVATIRMLLDKRPKNHSEFHPRLHYQILRVKIRLSLSLSKMQPEFGTIPVARVAQEEEERMIVVPLAVVS